jgi:Leucine-rich repeat (LRR) protein
MSSVLSNLDLRLNVDTEKTWTMFFPASARWGRAKGVLPGRNLRWNELTPASIEAEKLIVDDEYSPVTPTEFPSVVGQMSNLRSLSMPSTLIQFIDSRWIPSTLERLEITGNKSAAIPPSVVLPSIVELWANKTLFTRAQFPNLVSLKIQLGSGKKILATVGAMDALVRLECWDVRDNQILQTSTATSLLSLALVTGPLDTLVGLERFVSLAQLRLIALPRLNDVSALSLLKTLTTLTIGHCGAIESVDAILDLPKLRDLTFHDCADSPQERLKAALPTMRLEKVFVP